MDVDMEVACSGSSRTLRVTKGRDCRQGGGRWFRGHQGQVALKLCRMQQEEASVGLRRECNELICIGRVGKLLQ